MFDTARDVLSVCFASSAGIYMFGLKVIGPNLHVGIIFLNWTRSKQKIKKWQAALEPVPTYFINS